MITTVTLAAGRGPDGARQGDRQAPAGDPELRQHRHPVQRQDRHPDQRRDDASRASVDARGGACDRTLLLGSPTSTAALRDRHPKSPLDAAILAATADRGRRCAYRKLDEMPFDFERRRVRRGRSRATPRTRLMLVTKGAPESRAGGLHAAVTWPARPATSGRRPARGRVPATLRALSGAGLRVLAVAYRDAARPGRALRPDDERDLVFAGFPQPSLDPAAGRTPRRRCSAAAARRRGGQDPDRRQRAGGPPRLPRGRPRRQRVVLGRRHRALDRPGARARRRASAVFARVSPAAEEPHHPRAQAARPRGRLPRRRHQRRAVAARRRRRHLGRQRGRRRARGRGRSSCSTAACDVLHARHHRGAQGVRQRHEVPADGDQLELRQHVQHGGGIAVPAVPADAAHADPAQQLPLRPRADHDPDRQRGPQSISPGRSAGTSA